MLRRQADVHGDKVAYRDAQASISYAGLLTATANLAGHLRDSGVAPGDRVAIFLPNSVPWVVSCYAIARAGAVSVPVSYESVEGEIAYRLSDAGCRVVITTDERADLVARLMRALPAPKVMILVDRGARYADGLRYADLIGRPASAPPADPNRLDEPAYIIYTSGTTGRAKGVLLTARGMLWVAAACWAPIANLSKNDVVLSPLPLFHSYALNLSVLSILAVGASEYIMEKYSTSEALRLLQTGQFTFMPGVPTMFHYLLQAAKDAGVAKLPGLTRCVSAGAILPGPLNRAFEERFGIPLLDGYGITETSTMVTMNWPVGARVMGSCGLPVPGLAVRIVDPASGRDAAFGEEGELIVRGPNVMIGYHNKPAETAAALRHGWYHTGDLAKSDANGYLTITGRLKELIIRGGQNIAPAEIEEVVNAFEDVLDCAVIGVPHEHLGEVPVVFVVQRPANSVDIEGLLAHCRKQLSAYKVPQAVHLVTEIPRTGSGKIMRFKLRERLKDTSAA